MSFEDIKLSLYNFANITTNSNKVWVHNLQNAVRPSYPFGLISMVSILRKGKHQDIQGALLPNDFEEKAESVFQLVFTFSYFGLDAQQVMLDMLSNSTLTSNRKLLYSSGLGFETFSQMRDLSIIEKAEMINRFEIDMTFNVIIEAEQVTPFIKTFEYTGTIDYPTKP